MSDRSKQFSTKLQVKTRDFQYPPTSLLHNESDSGRAPPLGFPTEEEVRRRAAMLSIAPPPSSATEASLLSKISQRRESESFKPDIDQVPIRRIAPTQANEENEDPSLELRKVKNAPKDKPLIELDDPKRIPSQKAQTVSPYEEAILNPIPLPNAANDTPSSTQSKKPISLPTHPKREPPAPPNPSTTKHPAPTKETATTKASPSTIPADQPPKNPIPEDRTWFASVFITLLTSPPANFEPRAFTEEANHLPLSCLRQSFIPLLHLIRRATVENAAIEARAAKLVLIPETTRATLCKQYCWRAHQGRSWVFKWVGRGGGDWVGSAEGGGGIGGEGIGEETRKVVEGMGEAEVRSEMVCGLEFLGEVLERSRCYESWVGAFEERERIEGVNGGEGVRGREKKRKESGGSVGVGVGEERMSLEKALKEMGPDQGVGRKDG